MKKILAISLSLILLFTNMGFSIATHYCGGHAVKSKFVLGEKSLDCGMEKMDNDCASKPNNPSITKKECCENQYLSLNLEDDFQPTVAQKVIDTNFIFTFAYTFIELLNPDIEQEVAYRDYSPPFRNIDSQVMFQSFLI